MLPVPFQHCVCLRECVWGGMLNLHHIIAFTFWLINVKPSEYSFIPPSIPPPFHPSAVRPSVSPSLHK